MENNNIYYVYKHLNPTTKEVFYIGIGKGHRVFDGGSKRNNKWKQYVYDAGGFLFEFVVKNISKKEALLIERNLILEYGLENLTNIVGEQGNSTAFKKGQTPWNKGLKGVQAPCNKKVLYNNKEFDCVKDLRNYLKISNTHFYRLKKQGKLNVVYIHNSN